MVKRTLFIAILSVLFSLMVVGLGIQAAPTTYAQDGEASTPIPVGEDEETACTQLTTLALETVDQLCQDIGRNQACYGNVMVNAEPRITTENLVFDKAGDITSLTAIRSLKLGGLDIANNEWGVAMLRLQANVPDTLPGQNVTFLLFGDVELEDATNAITYRTMTARTGLNVRLTPSETAPILGSFAEGAQIETSGRYGDWVQVKYAAHPGLTGWISAELLDGPVAVLPEVDVRSKLETPMQSVYFKSGVGEPQCADAPQDGMLVQSPQGIGLVHFSINGVDLQMGSTAFISVEDDELSYTLIEGKAFVSSNNVIQRVFPGQETHVEVDESGEAVGAPSYPDGYDAPPAEYLRPMLEMLPAPVEYLPAPLEAQPEDVSAQEIADFIASTTASVATRTPPYGMVTSEGQETATATETPAPGSTEEPTDEVEITETPSPTDPDVPTATETPEEVTPTDDVTPTDIVVTDIPPTDVVTVEPPTDIPPTNIISTDAPPPATSVSNIPPTSVPALCAYNEDVEVIAVFIAEATELKAVKYDLYLLDEACNEVYVGRVKALKPAVFLTHVSRVWLVRDARTNTELLRWTPTIGGEFTVWLSGGSGGSDNSDNGD